MPRLLIVDDETLILNALKRLFRRNGFEVETANGGEEALAKLDAFAPDVVISDFRMPGMNGAELLGRVKRQRPAALRVVLSGFADLESVVTSVNEGEICRFISKPWDDAQLVKHIQQLLDQRQVLAQLARVFGEGPRAGQAQVLPREGGIELRVTGGVDAPFTSERAIELLRRVLGAIHQEHLNLVAGILERDGGRLSLTAEIGKLETLSLEFPVAAAEVAP
jgi:CheY-like chemotaxis protein